MTKLECTSNVWTLGKQLWKLRRGRHISLPLFSSIASPPLSAPGTLLWMLGDSWGVGDLFTFTGLNTVTVCLEGGEPSQSRKQRAGSGCCIVFQKASEHVCSPQGISLSSLVVSGPQVPFYCFFLETGGVFFFSQPRLLIELANSLREGVSGLNLQWPLNFPKTRGQMKGRYKSKSELVGQWCLPHECKYPVFLKSDLREGEKTVCLRTWLEHGYHEVKTHIIPVQSMYLKSLTLN